MCICFRGTFCKSALKKVSVLKLRVCVNFTNYYIQRLGGQYLKLLPPRNSRSREVDGMNSSEIEAK